jgi:hypothetical protein
LNNLSFLFWNHNTPCLYMAMSDFKDNHRNPSELSHGPSFLMFAAKSQVSSVWLMSLSKLQPCLQLCRFVQTLLKTKVIRWKAHFLLRTCEKDPCASFIRTGGVLLKIRNWKEECCTWSLLATTSRILTLKLTASLRLLVRSFSLLFQSLA